MRPGTVRELSPGFAGQAEAHVVLALEHPPDVVHHLRLVVPQPGQQRHRLAGHHMLAGHLKGPGLGTVRPPLQRVGIGPVVGGDDAVAGGLSILAPQVKPLAVAADRHPRHVCRINASLLKNIPYDAAVGFPHFLHVPLDEAGPGREHSRIATRHADLAAPNVVQRGLRGSAAVVQAQEVFHCL